MNETFDAGWLAQRERFDATSRDLGLARRLSQILPPRPRILDLGAGTGSLFRWLAPIIGRAQQWTLVDADSELLRRALEVLADWAISIGYPVTATNRAGSRALLIHSNLGAWRIETDRGDLADGFDGLRFRAHDAVVCSALLDLVSAQWLDRFSATLRAPLLACLSIDGRRAFMPRDPLDPLILAAFRRDQRCDKGFGFALGPDAPSRLHRLLASREFSVRSATSDWRIRPADPAMLATIVSNHAELGARWYPARRVAIDRWRDARMRQVRGGRLAIGVGHRDILALPQSV